MSYVNQTKKNNNIYDIQDKRIPDVTNEDVNKALIVDEQGSFKFGVNGTPVIANPTLEGGENELNSIQIGDEIYKIAGFKINSGISDSEAYLSSIIVDRVRYKVNANAEFNGNFISGNETNNLAFKYSRFHLSHGGGILGKYTC